MARNATSEHDSVGSDSFLDVITNFVGILIILVMVVGENARRFPLGAKSKADAESLAAAEAEANAIEQDVHRIASQLESEQAELASRVFERDQVNTLVTAVEHDLAARRAALDEESRKRFDLQRDLALAKDELARLARERQDADKTVAPKTITIDSYPTPIGKMVDGKEVHFQLTGGRITFVPFEALIDKLKIVARERAQKMDGQSEIVDSLGPVGGFRMRYTLERLETPHGNYLQLAHVELLPTSNQLGEPMDEALSPKSRLREKLDMMPPRQYTITVWTYPDSFTEFRKLKKELYGMGYLVAGRPLPVGMPIGASPRGSKSSAE